MRTQTKFIFKLFIGLVSFTLVSCDAGKQVDREAVKEGMKAQKIQRVTDVELMEKATEIGNNVWKYIAEGDSTQLPLIEQVGFDVDTILWGDDPFTTQDKNIFEAYYYAFQNKLPVENGIQGEEQEKMIFTAPYIEEKEIKGVIFVKIEKKDIVLSID